MVGDADLSGAALYQVYRYPHRSALAEAERTLRLATFTDEDTSPHFFEGKLVRAGRVAGLLRGLMHVVQARFHVPAAMLGRILALADPVVTCSEDRVRFEGFSACCGAYARVDLLPEAIVGDSIGRGTTNVDFNEPMLFALTKLRDGDDVSIFIGSEEVALRTSAESVVEKKVRLPLRWLKGFVEVQACQSRMILVHDVPALEARRFLRSLPRIKTHRRPTWIVKAGHGLRCSQTERTDSVRVGGLERLRVLEGLCQHASRLKVFADDLTGASAWELDFDDCRFHLVVSPEVWRGFSGEGQALQAAASQSTKRDLATVQAALTWEAVIDLERLEERLTIDPGILRGALCVLGTRGLVGYDLSESAFFHRVLPFNLELVEQLQPRLKSARRLLDSGSVTLGKASAEHAEVLVRSADVTHRVRLFGSEAICTCPWYAKHQDSRGPCKHILAAQIATEGLEDE